MAHTCNLSTKKREQEAQEFQTSFEYIKSSKSSPVRRLSG